MKFINSFIIKLFSIAILFNISITNIQADEQKINAITDQIEIITNDLKTLEKAIYKTSDITSKSSSSRLNEDVLTKHLLKLNEIEDQFRELTNRFEEVNFKLDKLSSRVTKIQSDTQLRMTEC